MSPKYRLRPATSIFTESNSRRREKPGHSIFLPMVMISVIGMTFIMVASSKPPSLSSDGVKGKNRPASGRHLSVSPAEKIPVRDISLDLSKLNDFQPREDYAPVDSDPINESAVTIKEKESFVSQEKLAVLDPLLDQRDIEKIEIKDSEYIPGSIRQADASRRMEWSTAPSGLPKARAVPSAKPVIKAKPVAGQNRAPIVRPKSRPIKAPFPDPMNSYSQVSAPANCPDPKAKDCSPEACLELTNLRDHELQINLPGKTHRVRVGDVIDGDYAKVAEVGRFLMCELAKGSQINASLLAKPDLNFGVSVKRPEVPKARLAVGRDCECALPIIQSVPKGNFTPWMTPDALNQYILSKKQSSGRTFWQQGNWITAIEGRVWGGVQQYRIACDRTPSKSNFRWHYKIAQTREDFGRKLETQRRNGFTLVQSQMYMDAYNQPRFQAVWQRM